MAVQDDGEALARARRSLDGLMVGDAFGEQFFGPPTEVIPEIQARRIPEGPWRYTDDTEMALSVVEVLETHGTVEPDALAQMFARRREPGRGYGRSTYEILEGIRLGGDWRALSYGAFGGTGSFGNGAAMRVAPLGAWFAEAPMDTLVEQARRSAVVTHAHPEGVAGAVAVAVGAALAWQRRGTRLGPAWLRAVQEQLPAGKAREGIAAALELPANTDVLGAAEVLGNGGQVSAEDTVPLCLWITAQAEGFVDALWTTVWALGDRDTTCAIVGGMLACARGTEAVPASWRARLV